MEDIFLEYTQSLSNLSIKFHVVYEICNSVHFAVINMIWNHFPKSGYILLVSKMIVTTHSAINQLLLSPLHTSHVHIHGNQSDVFYSPPCNLCTCYYGG